MDAYNRFSELYAQGRYKDALPFAEEGSKAGAFSIASDPDAQAWKTLRCSADLEKLRVFARLMKSSSHCNSISQCPYLLVAMRRGSILPSYFAITQLAGAPTNRGVARTHRF